MKLKERYRCWKNWAQYNTNSKTHKVLVLLGIVKSPTFNVSLNSINYKWAFEPPLKHPCSTCDYLDRNCYQDPCYKCYLNPRATEKVKSSCISHYQNKRRPY